MLLYCNQRIRRGFSELEGVFKMKLKRRIVLAASLALLVPSLGAGVRRDSRMCQKTSRYICGENLTTFRERYILWNLRQ